MSVFFRKVVFTVAFFSFLSCVSGYLEQSSDQTQLFRARQALLQQLYELDLQRLCQYGSSYLEELDASFDEDNRCYYIEKHCDKGCDSFLFIIDKSRRNETIITIYAPYESEYQWLICRLRNTRGQIFGRLLFMPGATFADPFELRLPGQWLSKL